MKRLILLVLLPAMLRTSRAELVVYPAPGDLSSVSHLQESRDYAVQVNQEPCFVYETDNYWDRSGPERPDRVAFTCFSFRNQPVQVQVTCRFPVRTVTIRPKSDGVRFSQRGETITFTLTRPHKLSIEINDRKRPLFLFADEPDVPDTEAQHYFGPGVHEIGARYPVNAKERVYIAGGAVVQGTLKVVGTDIKVHGRGILTGGALRSERAGIELCLIQGPWGKGTRHEYSGLCLVNSPGFSTHGGGDDIIIRNLKFIAWLGCTDGPHMAGRRGTMEDCFIFNNDDSIKLNAGDDWTVRDIVIWKGPWGRPITYLAGGREGHGGMTVEDVDVIGDEGRRDNAVITVKRIHGKGERGAMCDYTFRNIRVEEPRNVPLVSLRAHDFEIRNLRFENIRAEGRRDTEIELLASGNGRIENVQFQAVSAGGARLTGREGTSTVLKGAVSHVTFDGLSVAK
ncbi:MAG: hypothetical protein JXR37_08115 [Kiritimatiellae bacterium]|nr:hypothetical protein [Kiritimatiellia bacterium]